MSKSESTDRKPASELSRDERRERYGTLNPSGDLMCSDELRDELDRIVEQSAADGGRIMGTTGTDYANVQLVFSAHNAGVELGVFDPDDCDIRTNSGQSTDGGAEHKHDVGDVLEKVDSSEWKVTNRMIDVDTDEILYSLREVHSAPGFTETEILTESQIARSFETEGSA